MDSQEIKDAQEAREFLGSLKSTMAGYDDRLNLAQGSIDEVKGIVADVQTQLADAARRHSPQAEGLFAGYEKALTWDAIHKMPTAIRNRTGGSIYEYEDADPSDLIGKFQDASDRLYILAASMKLVDDRGNMNWPMVKQTKFYTTVYMPLKNAVNERVVKDGFSISVAGSGSEWDPTSFSTRLGEKARLPMKVVGLIPQFALPRSPYLFPIEVGDLTAYKVAEITTAPPILGTTAGYIPDGKGSTTVTSSVTFTSVKIATMAFVSKEAEEDLIIPALPYAEKKILQAVDIALEKAVIRGQKTTTIDTDVTAAGATDARKAFDGLFDYAYRVATSGNGSIKSAAGSVINSDANWRDYVRGARKLLDDPFKGDNGKLALICSGNTAIDVGSVEAFRTWYAMGGMSSNRNGDATGYAPDGLGAFAVSEYIRSDVDVTGINAASGNDYTNMIQFAPDAWLLGVERSMRLEVLRERFAEYDVDAVKVTWRGDLKPMYGSTVKHTVATVGIPNA